MTSALKLVSLALLSVGVSCLPGTDPFSKTVWATEKEVPSYDLKNGNLKKSVSNNITLVGGGSNKEGNVLLNGKPICDDKWDDRDAKVVCHMLGFSSDGAFATTKSQFGLVSTDFIMDDVQCKGEETDIHDCYHRDKDNCDKEEGAGVRCGVTPFDDELKEELEEIKDENKELKTKLSALMTTLTAFNDSLISLTIKTASNSKNIEGHKTEVDNVTQDVLSLKASDQKQERRIVENIEKLTSVSRHGKWCGYQDGWSTANSIINYDSLKFSSSNMDITSTPLNINTGIFTVPVSGAWRVTISMRSHFNKAGEYNYGYIYIKDKRVEESYQYTYYGGSGSFHSTGGREVTLAATAGDTIYFKTVTMKDYYYNIYFCVAFEHGSDQQTRFSARDEDIPSPQYQDSFPADDEDIPGTKYQDHFPAEDEEYFSADLEKSTCSSNTDCPPHLACIRSVLSSDPGTCGDPWCRREEWDCGAGARCIIDNHKPLCV